MLVKSAPLLCELHSHSTWSDGAFTIPALVDIYGRAGFDVLAVTDHTTRDRRHVNDASWTAYLAEIEEQAERALASYGLLLLPGLELTYDDEDPLRAAHAVAVGLHSFVGVDEGIDGALAAARSYGAALIAAHPNQHDALGARHGRTARFAAEWRELRHSVDRFELVNRDEVFGWVAKAGLPAVASGDFHRIEHLATWKTMLPCAKREEAVIAYLRSARPVYLVRIDGPAVKAA